MRVFAAVEKEVAFSCGFDGFFPRLLCVKGAVMRSMTEGLSCSFVVKVRDRVAAIAV